MDLSNENTNNSSNNSWSSIIPQVVLVLALVGYFMMGIEGALAVALLALLYSAVVVISLIPVVGIIGQYFLMVSVIQPFVFNLANISGNILTSWTFWIYFTVGIILQCLSLIFITAVNN